MSNVMSEPATTLTAAAEAPREPWSGILGVEWSPTADNRIIELGMTDHRDLPIPFSVQMQSAEGHAGSEIAGSIDKIDWIPLDEFQQRPDAAQFDLSGTRPGSMIIWGEGTLDGSEASDNAKRYLENGAGVSLDGLRYSGKLYDKASLEEINLDEMDMGDRFEALMSGDYLTGVSGRIAGVTVVSIPAFEEAKVLVASAVMQPQLRFENVLENLGVETLTAAGGPVKPPASAFENPRFTELTPWTVTKDRRVFGHLADWDGCHIGFQGICVPPFRSATDYSYFNNQEIETAEGELIAVGKVMFSRDGVGHAPTDDPSMTWQEAQRHYDDATHVGAFVRAGSDAFGTWIAGVLAPGLDDLEEQHMRTHGPSGDWRPIKPHDPTSELIASIAVPVQGFPIARKALVASANGEITAIITAPLDVPEDMGARRRQRKAIMLRERRRLLVGTPRERMREEAMRSLYDDGLAISSDQRKKWAAAGIAMGDGSYPITKCSGSGTSAINARRAIGRAPESKRNAVRAHIRKRENALGCDNGPLD